MPKSPQGSPRQIETSLQQILQDCLATGNEEEIEVGQVTPGQGTVTFGQEQTVARNIIGAQGTLLSRSLTLLMVDGAGGLIPDGVACTLNHHRPVELLVVEEVTGGHHACLLDDLTADHHGGTMTVGRRVGRVVLTVVQLIETNGAVAQSNA